MNNFRKTRIRASFGTCLKSSLVVPVSEPKQDENYSSSGRIIRPMNVLMYCPTCKKQARVALLNAATREKLRAEIESGTAIQVIHSDTEGDHIWTLSTEEAADLARKMKQGLV